MTTIEPCKESHATVYKRLGPPGVFYGLGYNPPLVEANLLRGGISDTPAMKFHGSPVTSCKRSAGSLFDYFKVRYLTYLTCKLKSGAGFEVYKLGYNPRVAGTIVMWNYLYVNSW